MFRWVFASSLAAVFATAGVVFAQEQIVDPWGGVSSWFGPEPGAARAAPPAADPLPVGVAAFEPAAPDLKPLGVLPLDLAVVEPWVPAPAPGKLAATAPREHRSVNWADPIHEIVDPWPSGAGVVARDPLIVDPWAR